VNVLEVKRRLDGGVRTYPCEAVEIAADRAVLLYRLPGQGRVAGLVLPAGTLTVAYYWLDRPYNVYHWMAPSGETLAYYFNLSGPVRIGPDRLEWEDLEVDVLVTPDGRVQILDEDAVPAEAAARLPEIARARERVLADWPAVVADVERASRAYQAASGVTPA
jgi:predicted RNA-binding protein associated with RNAse of E/G family